MMFKTRDCTLWVVQVGWHASSGPVGGWAILAYAVVDDYGSLVLVPGPQLN